MRSTTCRIARRRPSSADDTCEKANMCWAERGTGVGVESRGRLTKRLHNMSAACQLPASRGTACAMWRRDGLGILF